MKKLPPIPQSWYDDNRERFEAETTIVPIELPPHCTHQGTMKRISFSQVECTRCHAGWIDGGSWTIENGSIK